MSNILVDAYAKAGEIGSIVRWIEYTACDKGLVDAVTFSIILNSCYHKWSLSFQEIYRLYESVRKIRGADENLINEDTISLLRRIAIADANGNVAQAVAKLNLLGIGAGQRTSAFDSQSVHDEMATALAKGSPAKALKLYTHALQERIPLEPKVLVTAVNASLQVNGENLEVTARLIKDAQLRRQDTSNALASVFIYQLSKLDREMNIDSGRIESISRRTISAFEEHDMSVPVHVATHTASVLVNRGRYREAIDAWNSISRFQGVTPSSIDLVTLTVLLRAYIGLQDCLGMKWVLKMLDATNLTPDKRFVLLLKNARNTARKTVETSENYRIQLFLEGVIETLHSVMAMRARMRDEKEDVKFKALNIMEKAIEAQESREHNREMASLKTYKKLAKGQPAKGGLLSSRNTGEESSGAWMESNNEEPFYGTVVPTHRLVGVTAA